MGMGLDEILRNDKMARKWHCKTRKYYDYLLPAGSVLLVELDKKVSCAECGVQFTFGGMYASRFIHNHVGMGYAVCESCYNRELEEEEKYKDEQA
jgi:hypothetical protein|nr:MAG TPA: cysteine-rich protein [Caudoviricetes sp.]